MNELETLSLQVTNSPTPCPKCGIFMDLIIDPNGSFFFHQCPNCEAGS